MNKTVVKQEEKFNFFVPATIEKGADKDGNVTFKIKGIMSDDFVEDSDQEVLEVSGFDYRPFLTKGFFNWDHQAKKRASAIVGEPTLARTVSNGKGYQAYVEGFLYPNSVDAQEIVQLAEVLEKNSKTRRLGYSIEGAVISKDPLNPKRITRARITGCAITPCPKNPNTIMQLMKGEYDELYVDNDDLSEEVVDVIKSMEVNQDLTQHDPISEAKHADKKCKCKEGHCKCNKVDVASYLKKSEIYETIANRYTNDATKAKEIYTFIENVNQKLFNMTTTEITNEALEKAFSFLDEASGFSKGEDNSQDDDKEDPKEDDKADDKKEDKGETTPPATPKKTDDSDDDDEEDDDDDDDSEDEEDEELAKGIVKGLLKKGKSEKYIKKALIKGGYSVDLTERACAACISQASAQKDGGTISTVSAPVVKSEESAELHTEEVINTPSLTKGEVEDLIKGLAGSIGTKFTAIGQILQFSKDQDVIVKSELNSLHEEIKGLTEIVKGIASQPVGRKSLVGAVPVERFAKSEDNQITNNANHYDLNKSEDVKALADRLYNETLVAHQSGRPNELLEKAVGDLEISKSIDKSSAPALAARGISFTPRRK